MAAETFLLNTPTIAETDKGQNTWRPLRFFSLYRIILAGLFVALQIADALPSPLGKSNPELFFWISLFYLLFATAARFAVHYQWPSFGNQVALQVFFDIIAITLMMHSSGGIASGLGVLLVVSIAGGSMLSKGRTIGLSFAALASVGLLGEQFFMHVKGLLSQGSYSQSGLLGAALFATAALAYTLAQRIRESEALAEQRGVDLADMAQVTEFIIQQMRTGVMVVDPEHRIVMMNSAAWNLLGKPGAGKRLRLSDISPALNQRLGDWKQRKPVEQTPLSLPNSQQETIPRFKQIGTSHTVGTLVFLEDATLASRQAQQIKLASLGRLTASIAHEVRNPLGAISHASQLLAESEEIPEADKRLTTIIDEQSKRVNTIIETVMQLSRRDRFFPATFPIQPWLEKFVMEFIQGKAINVHQVALSVEPDELEVRIDPDHLNQILCNLCSNGLHHAQASTETPKLELKAGTTETGRPYLDVIDNGPGVAQEVLENIFEPFFTTESRGTGLGLYISRELAECNQGHLHYLPTPDGLSRFRIAFADPKQQVS